ncbi:hypothetical protein JCGZ_15049 [Jatropha curcas]|uniref:Uncharacterized protein n=1 Tax=Jatropha curcas TaxID=180498 RepID=A0A067LLF2_JATCU|nr:ankyrin repeat-containing protein At5g02620 [Jatropha curcas]KDP45184.1 hypothetical protein JCGZ_15049 [Jatropha curcas]
MDQRLYIASCNGDVRALQELLKQDPLLLHNDILTPSDTALHIAIKLGHLDFAKVVLNRNPELATEINQQGFSPIHLASTKGYSQIVTDLLNINSKLCFLKDCDGRTPLHCAAIKGRQVVMELLLSCCPDAAKELTHREETVLHLAIKNKQCEAFKSLLSLLVHKNLVDDLVNCVDQDGNTMLHLAAARRQVQTIRILLKETKVNVSAVNSNGHTAFDIAKLITSGTDDMIIEKMLYEAHQQRGSESPEEQIVVVDSLQNEAIPTTKYSENLTVHAITTNVGTVNPSEPLRRLGKRFESVKNGIIILASMSAAFSFGAALSPPGGLWQDWPSSNNFTNTTQTTKIEKFMNSLLLDPIRFFPKKNQFLKTPCLNFSSPNLFHPGKAMNIALASYDFVRFLYSDALCFTSSLVTIVLIIITPARGDLRNMFIFFMTLIIIGSSMYLYYCVLALIANEQFAGWAFKMFARQISGLLFTTICFWIIPFFLIKIVDFCSRLLLRSS